MSVGRIFFSILLVSMIMVYFTLRSHLKESPVPYPSKPHEKMISRPTAVAVTPPSKAAPAAYASINDRPGHGADRSIPKDMEPAEIKQRFAALFNRDTKPSAEELRQLADQMFRQDFSDPSAYEMLAYSEMAKENLNPREALGYVEKGLALSPQDPELRELWLSLKVLDGGFDIESYSAQNPGDSLARYFYAVDLWKQGDFDQADGIFNFLAAQAPPGSNLSQLTHSALANGSPPLSTGPFSLEP